LAKGDTDLAESVVQYSGKRVQQNCSCFTGLQ